MERENCWVWFKGSLKEKSHWKPGFICLKDEKDGLVIENQNFVKCRVPEWRVSKTEPIDLSNGPEIPEGVIWKTIV